jgi:hypothetical protein
MSVYFFISVYCPFGQHPMMPIYCNANGPDMVAIQWDGTDTDGRVGEWKFLEGTFALDVSCRQLMLKLKEPWHSHCLTRWYKQGWRMKMASASIRLRDSARHKASEPVPIEVYDRISSRYFVLCSRGGPLTDLDLKFTTESQINMP